MTDPVRRVHYFAGQLLTPEDLQAEQDYHREMRYLHNRLLGHGVVEGFGVTVGDGAGGGDGSTVTVSPGLAIDAYGRELVLPDPVQVEVSGRIPADGSGEVIATWDQQPDAFAAATDDCADDVAFTRWLERPCLTLGSPGEAPAGAVVLGRVHFSGGRATAVDPSGRSTWRRAHL